MPDWIVDTNVAVVAQGNSHMSEECQWECISFIEEILNNKHIVIIDNNFHILREYQTNLSSKGSPKYGDRFLKWVLNNQANPLRVIQVPITEVGPNHFEEFPQSLEDIQVDPSDKKFIAVSIANEKKGSIVECADSKWIGWHHPLLKEGIKVHFICKAELALIFNKKKGIELL
jgi:hypothetical protein